MKRHTIITQLWLVLLLGSVGGASLIPQGYMPGLNPAGQLALILCSGEVIDSEDTPLAAETSVCWFSALQLTAILPPSLFTLGSAVALFHPLTGLLPSNSDRTPSYFARAPPALS